eukprot:1632659-Pyramimonas_sp.AAC.1
MRSCWRTRDVEGKAQAAQVLSNLAVNSDNKVAIARAGAVEPLVQPWCALGGTRRGRSSWQHDGR